MNFVRKAAAATSNLARSKLRDTDETKNLRDRVSLPLKTTSSKDARTTAKLAIRSGHMSKRNEQGSWSKRFVCMVPHMFLYYFDNDQSESPRGVVDLEYFTNFNVNDENILTVSASEGIPFKPYYFQVDDTALLSEWMASFSRDRFHLIKDERDAYQALQDQFSGEMDYASKIIESSASEKEKMQLEVAESRAALDETLCVLQRLIAVASDAGDANSFTLGSFNCNDINSACDSLQKIVVSMRSKSHEVCTKAHEETLHIKESYQKETLSLQEQLKIALEKVQIETACKGFQDMNMQQLKQDYESKIRELEAKIAILETMLEDVTLSKVAIIESSSILTEQKKILIKEVKQLRKLNSSVSEKVLELETCNIDLGIQNRNLTSQISSLKAQVDDIQNSMKGQKNYIKTQHGLDHSLKDLNFNSERVGGTASIGRLQSVFPSFVVAEPEEAATPSPKAVEIETVSQPCNHIQKAVSTLMQYDWLTDEQRSKIAERDKKAREDGLLEATGSELQKEKISLQPKNVPNSSIVSTEVKNR